MLAQLDRLDEAQTSLQRALQEKPERSLSWLEKTLPTRHRVGPGICPDGLRKAGLPGK